MNTQTLRRFGPVERWHNPRAVFCSGVFCAVLGALAVLGVVFWVFQMIIRLLTHQNLSPLA
jgi:hypothetical protein